MSHLGIVGILVLLGSLLGDVVAPRIVEESGFSVIGIEVRTNNAREMTGLGAIPGQWEKFYKQGILEKIPGKADSNTYGVYCDYASDRNGDYTLVIGARVRDGAAFPIPAGMVLKKVAKGKYAVVTSEKGPVGKVVSGAWQQIWGMEDKKEIARAYQADYEVYDERARDPQNSQVDVYVGIK
jgi:predicted transcriptional regulator YdeE